MIDIKFSSMYEIMDATHDQPTLGAGGILILGTSTDGPAFVIRRLYNVKDAIRVFGNGEIVTGYKEARAAGATRVYAMRISGKRASTLFYTEGHVPWFNRATFNRTPFNRTLSGPLDINHPGIVLTSISSGSKYNDYSIVVGQVSITINFGGQTIALYELKGTKTLRHLAEEIDKDSLIHGISAVAIRPNVPSTYLHEDEVNLSGGTDEQDIEPEERKLLLQQAYDMIEDSYLDIDVVVPQRATIDGPTDYSTDLSLFCARRTDVGYGTIGVMGVSNMSTLNPEEIILPKYKKHITVIAARPIFYTDELPEEGLDLFDEGRYISNGVCSYAGLIQALPVNASVMKKSIGANNAIDNLNEEDRINLINHGITTIRPTFRGWCITKGVTMLTDSTFDNVDNMRLVSYVQRFIRASFDDYIGNSVIEAIDAEREIGNLLQDLVEQRAIRDYSFSIDMGRHDMNVNIDMVPIYGISTISASLRLLIRM